MLVTQPPLLCGTGRPGRLARHRRDGHGQDHVHQSLATVVRIPQLIAVTLTDNLDTAILCNLPPIARDKSFATHVEACLAFLGELLLHDILRRDAGVIGSGYPECLVTSHAPPADQEILNGHVETVAHM